MIPFEHSSNDTLNDSTPAEPVKHRSLSVEPFYVMQERARGGAEYASPVRQASLLGGVVALHGVRWRCRPDWTSTYHSSRVCIVHYTTNRAQYDAYGLYLRVTVIARGVRYPSRRGVRCERICGSICSPLLPSDTPGTRTGSIEARVMRLSAVYAASMPLDAVGAGVRVIGQVWSCGRRVVRGGS